MTPYAAQRIRFGILAARHMLERHRLTWDQLDYLDGCALTGWKVRDSVKAFDRERSAAIIRFRQEVARLTPTKEGDK